MKLFHAMKLSFTDFDMNQHVNNAAYHRILEETRLDVFARQLGVNINEVTGVLRDTYIRYGNGIPFKGYLPHIKCELIVKNIDGGDVEMDFKIYNDKGEVTAHGNTTQCTVSRISGKKTHLPEKVIRALYRNKESYEVQSFAQRLQSVSLK